MAAWPHKNQVLQTKSGSLDWDVQRCPPNHCFQRLATRDYIILDPVFQIWPIVSVTFIFNLNATHIKIYVSVSYFHSYGLPRICDGFFSANLPQCSGVLVLIIYFLKIHDVTLSFQLLNILKFVSICNAKIAGSPYDRVALFQSPQSILLNDHGRKHWLITTPQSFTVYTLFNILFIVYHKWKH